MLEKLKYQLAKATVHLYGQLDKCVHPHFLIYNRHAIELCTCSCIKDFYNIASYVAMYIIKLISYNRKHLATVNWRNHIAMHIYYIIII